MTLHLFLEYFARSKQLFLQETTLCFFGKDYPLLFLNYLFSFCRRYSVAIERLNCMSIEMSSIKALLATMSFSGQNIYWLENFHIMPIKKQQELVAYFQTYTGPHKIIFFSQEAISGISLYQGIKIIMMPQEIPVHECSIIRFLITDKDASSQPFLSNVAMYTKNVSLDMACLLMFYELVLGKKFTDFFTEWAVHIIEPTNSLFLLSQYLFAKNQKLFFSQWAKMYVLYVSSFWVTFWADQMWRAYIFCDLMKQKKYVDAKKAQYKLPFSFINRDWLSCSLVELQNAHQLLYNIDFRLKNGGSDLMLEHFYAQFFDGRLKNKP